MAAPVNNLSCWSAPEVYKHHEQHKVCISRPKYREGRRAKAVKVYTINLESRYVMVQGVPAIGVMQELIQLCALYGAVEEYRPLDEYPAEEFTEVYLVKFQKLTSARAAKRHMDEKSFYGGVLHVCYVPEYETVEDTRLKLQDRRRYVIRTAQNKAREKEQRVEGNKDPTQPDALTASERTTPRAEPIPDNSNAGESSSTSHYSDFPLLPFPPQQDYHYRHNSTYGQPFQTNRHSTVPTEDKMGTLHNAVMDTKQQPAQSSSSGRSFSNVDGGTKSRATPSQASAVRLLPRTTHLEIRKRRLEQTEDHLVFGVPGKNEPLIGPKLPEPPKLDMEDESLNTTAKLIRNTMKKVAAIPDVKPPEKKTKPRRRI